MVCHLTEGTLRCGETAELTLKIYMLCTTTGIWRPTLLTRAWKMKATMPACSHTPPGPVHTHTACSHSPSGPIHTHCQGLFIHHTHTLLTCLHMSTRTHTQRWPVYTYTLLACSHTHGLFTYAHTQPVHTRSLLTCSHTQPVYTHIHGLFMHTRMCTHTHSLFTHTLLACLHTHAHCRPVHTHLSFTFSHPHLQPPHSPAPWESVSRL